MLNNATEDLLNDIRILLIDSNVPQYQTFIDSVNIYTIPIVYSSVSTKSEILQQLRQTCTKTNRIGFVFESNGPQYLFLDEQLLFLPGESVPYSKNMQFMIDIINEFNVQIVDFLACDTLTFPEWKMYYELLSNETGVIVGASDNNTGNIKYGGDWVMESTCQDIEFVYFTENIEYYTFLLGGGNITVILTTGGNVCGTGYNGGTSFGILGLGTNTATTITQFTAVNNSNLDYKTVKQIASNAYANVLLMTDGTIYGAGYTPYYSPSLTLDQGKIFTQLPNTTGKQIKQVACGASFVLLLMTDGTIYAQGLNSVGQLGGLCDVNSSLSSLTQYPMPSGKQVSSISISTSYSNHVVFAMTDGTLYGTGWNNNAQLGLGNTTNINILTNIPIPNSKLANTVWSGGVYTCVLMTDGTLYFAGNIPGLGIASYTLSQSPALPSGKTLSAIACGGNHFVLLMTDGTIYGMGSNGNGNLGFASTVSSVSTFTAIPIPDGKTSSKVACGANHTVVLMTDGTLYGTGYRGNGQLGTATPLRQYGLTQLTIPNNETVSLIMDDTPTLVDSIVGTAPTITSITTGTTSFNVFFTAGTGGVPTPSTYYYSTNGGSTYTNANTTTSPIVISSGVSQGVTYQIALKATNTAGNTVASNMVAATIPKIGTAPTITSITVGTSSFSVFFTAGTGGTPAPTTYQYSLNGGSTYTNANTTTSPIVISSGISPEVAYQVTLIATNAAGNTAASNMVVANIAAAPCFLEGSKILRLNLETDQEEYVAVETLREGDLIKTSRNGYKAVFHIGRKTLPNPANDPDKRNRLYRFPKSVSKNMIADLCITGEHCVLYKDLSPILKSRVHKHMGDIYITEYQYRVPACLDERATAYTGTKAVTIWHFALESDNIYYNYGVYANGLLVESCSIQYLTELSNMELV